QSRAAGATGATRETVLSPGLKLLEHLEEGVAPPHEDPRVPVEAAGREKLAGPFERRLFVKGLDKGRPSLGAGDGRPLLDVTVAFRRISRFDPEQDTGARLFLDQAHGPADRGAALGFRAAPVAR